MPVVFIQFIFFLITVGAIYILWLYYRPRGEEYVEEDPVERMEEAIHTLQVKIKATQQKIPSIETCRETTLANIDVQKKYHQEWLSKAKEAILSGDEDWGKDCIKRALIARNQLEGLNQELELFDQKMKQLGQSLEDHQYKLDTITGKYQSIQARMELAQTEQDMNLILEEVHSGKIFSLIKDIQNQVAEDEHRIEAMNDLYRSNELSMDEVDELLVSEELEKLKKNAG